MNQLLKRKNSELLLKKKKGFTLIELIIVIAIIAIIAAIAIPKFGQVKENSNLASDQANAKIIATAIAQAVSDGVVPDQGDVTNDANFVKYIDGGKLPKAKSTGATGFHVSYTEDTITKDKDGKNVTTLGKGTVITLSGIDKQVYPVD